MNQLKAEFPSAREPLPCYHHAMTRTEAIAIINAKLADLDDERVETVAAIVQSMDAPDDLPRELTARELALIEQSKQDFKAGRTYTLDEMDTYLDAAAAKRALTRSA